MELRESIESINKKLLDDYGRDIASDRPKFKLVFSDDEYEKRLTDFTDEGFELLHPEVRLLPKYKQYIRGKYILERLIPVPEGVETDLVDKMIYDVLWVFQDSKGKYLPPFFAGCQHVIEAMYQAMGKANTFTKYKDKNISPEEHAAHLKKVEDELFGNETETGDHLAYGTGISSAGDGDQHKIIIPENGTIN